MSNKLKDIFSKKTVEFDGKISFKDTEAKTKFFDALASVFDQGRTVEVDGVSAMSTSMKDGNNSYPLMRESAPTKFIVSPPFESSPITVPTPLGERTVKIQCCATTSYFAVKTDSEAIVFLEFTFVNSNKQIQFIYRTQLEFANKTIDMVESYYEAIGILNYFFTPDEEADISDGLDSFHVMKQSFQTLCSFWEKMCAIESELNLSFEPKKIGNIEDHILEVDELYLLLIEKKAIRLDYRITATESAVIPSKSTEFPLKIGQAIDLNFISEITYLICEQSIVIYTANLLTNAIIKEFSKTENGEVKVLYGDNDSNPMYISCTGHKTSDEATDENKLVTTDSTRIKKYKEALSVSEYFQQKTYKPRARCE